MAAADAAAAELRAKRYEDTMAGLQIPMMGFEQAAQKQAQREAMQIQALQEAGGAAVLGGTPGLAAMGAEEDLARMAQIDQMEYARNLELARNQQAISDANLALQANLIGMELAGAQQASAQAEMQKLQLEYQGKMQLKQAEIAFDIEKMKAEAELKSQLMAEEFNYNVKLAEMQGIGLSEREKAREVAKEKRISQQNSQQSKLINQRKNNLPPMNFESNEDSLDGFDFAEFSPR